MSFFLCNETEKIIEKVYETVIILIIFEIIAIKNYIIDVIGEI